MRILRLEKMGCDFSPEDMAASDCTNYRLRMPEILTKDGKLVCGDFSRGVRYDFSRKKPVRVSDWQIFTDLQYTDQDGMTWRYTPDGKGGTIADYRNVTQSPFYGLDYTLANILTIVNTMAVDPFDSVEVAK